jgi:hypothetical protein
LCESYATRAHVSSKEERFSKIILQNVRGESSAKKKTKKKKCFEESGGDCARR